jgi:hypothetical protein
MNKFRFTLGKKPDTSLNLVTNGTFTGSLTGWTAGSQWNYVSGTAECYSGGAGFTFSNCFLSQASKLTPGYTYQLSFDLKKSTSHTDTNNGEVYVLMGGTYFNLETNKYINAGTTFVNQLVKGLKCNYGTTFGFFCIANGFSNCAIDNVLLYTEVWNDPIEDEPVDWDKTEISKKRDEALNGLIFEYIANVKFVGDGYDYIYQYSLDNGFCGEIPVLIERYNIYTLNYEIYFEGNITISKCKFNLSKREVEVDIEEVNSAMSFIDNKERKVCLKQSAGFPYNMGTPPDSVDAEMSIDFNNDVGAYPTGGFYEDNVVYNIHEALRRIVMISTNYRFDFESTFFSSGTFENFGVGLIAETTRYINDALHTYDDLKMSFETLFTELNYLFNLSFSIDRSGLVPKIVVEPKIDYYNSTPVLTITNPSELEVSYEDSKIYKVVNIGYNKIDDTPTETNLDLKKGVQFFTIIPCAKGELTLVSDFIQKSTVLKNILSTTITDKKYVKDFYFIETDGTQTTNSGSGTYDYNINIDPEDNLERHAATLNSSFFSTQTTESIFVEKTNDTFSQIISFKYPLSKDEFDSITQAFETIQIITNYKGVNNKEAFLLSAQYSVKDGLTEFKLLTT